MKIFDLLKRLFSSNTESNKALELLNSRIEQHPVLKFQIENIDNVLANFTKEKLKSESNFGLTICATEGAGKTFFIVEFLLDYFYSTQVISNRKVLKLTSFHLAKQSDGFEVLLEFKKKPFGIKPALLKHSKDCIVMIDDLKPTDLFFPRIKNAIEEILKNREYRNTVFILSSGEKRLESLKRKWEVENFFSNEYQLNFPAPNALQLFELFDNYCSLKQIKLNPNTKDCLVSFFKVKEELSDLSYQLVRIKKLSNRKKENFVYARELHKLLDSIIISSNNTIDENDIINAPFYISTLQRHMHYKSQLEE